MNVDMLTALSGRLMELALNPWTPGEIVEYAPAPYDPLAEMYKRCAIPQAHGCAKSIPVGDRSLPQVHAGMICQILPLGGVGEMGASLIVNADTKAGSLTLLETAIIEAHRQGAVSLLQEEYNAARDAERQAAGSGR